jgi:hypothetical protein
MSKSRLAKQKVNMLWHDHIPENPKPEPAPHALQSQLKNSSVFVSGKQTTAVIAAASNEITLPAALKPRQSPRHEDNPVSSPAQSL